MKRTYHTKLLIKCNFGILGDKIIKEIPNSTFYNWRQREFSHIIGLPSVEDEEINIMREISYKEEIVASSKDSLLCVSNISISS